MILSIVIPNFNSGELLEESLNSIFKDPVSISFEVLIMDNCSSDFPEQIVEKYHFDNLFFYSEPDSGIYDAMNKGIIRAKGEWIYFMGAGDTLNIPYFLRQDLSKFDFVYGDIYMEEIDRYEFGEKNLFGLLKLNLCHQRIFYRKTIFEEVGGYKLEYPIMADYHINLLCFFNKNVKIAYFPEKVGVFKGGGISSINSDRKFEKLKPKLALIYLIKSFSIIKMFYVFQYSVWIIRNKIRIEINKIIK